MSQSITIKNKEFIPLKFDLMFKKVFGDPNCLEPIRYLLKVVLEMEPKEIVILNSELIGRPYKDKKVCVDLIVELDSETKVGIEINTSVNQTLIDRNFYYLCRNISKDIPPSEEYRNLKKHIQVNLDFEGSHEEGVEKYSLVDENNNKKLTNLLQIIRIDVPYYKERCYNEDIKDLDSFTKLVGLFDVEDRRFAKRLCGGDQKMGEIYDRIEKYNNDEDVIGAYDYELKQKLILESKQAEALEQGIKQGIKDGISQGISQGIEQGSMQEKIEIAKNFLKENVDREIISKATGLSLETLEQFEKENK